MYHQADVPSATRLPEKWKLPKVWGDWALSVRHDWTEEHVRALAKLFREYHEDKKTEKSDWELTWKKWVRNQNTEALRVKLKNCWWTSWRGVEKKGYELGLKYEGEETFPYFKLRVFKAAGNGPWSPQKGK